MKEQIEMTVKMTVTKAQALALAAMFEYWNDLGNWGSSREVAFFADGDGNFRPNCRVEFSEPLELTAEIREMAVIRNNDGDRLYDFDPVAWHLHDLENPSVSMVHAADLNIPQSVNELPSATHELACSSELPESSNDDYTLNHIETWSNDICR